jgi:N-acetylglucosamine-6-phosphate deacetylase
MGDSYIVKAGSIALPGTMLEGACLAVDGGIVDYVGREDASAVALGNPRFKDCRHIDLRDSVILPGLTEMHIHGAFGLGFESLDGGGELAKLAAKLQSRGIGRFVPTLVWDEGAVVALIDAIESSGLPRSVLPGIYLEGPFIASARRGGIGETQVRKPDLEFLERILSLTRGYLKIMTVAPELDGAPRICARLAEAGVRVSLGHSAADSLSFLPPPPFSITHLFNAMSGFDHRRGGLANIALAGKARWVELNADGVHVSADAMRVASRCVEPGSLILTSDAVVAAGLPFGEFEYFGRKVVSDSEGVRYSDSSILIGSNRLGMEIVLSYCRATGSPLASAIASMSKLPAEVLGLSAPGSRGIIEPGASDDLFVWDRDFTSCKPLRQLAEASR